MKMTAVAEDTNHATYRWRLPYGFVANFGGKSFRLDDPNIRGRWLRSLDDSSPNLWVMPKQQHGSLVLRDFKVTNHLENFCDGFAATDRSLGLAVFGSDCPGLVLVSPNSFAIAHCGWRGIVAGIVKSAVNAICLDERSDIGTLAAFVGPGICRNCYEVGSEVMAAKRWPETAKTTIDERIFLDIPLSIALELRGLGVKHITQCGVCTSCDPDLHSYRKQGPGVVQVMAVHAA